VINQQHWVVMNRESQWACYVAASLAVCGCAGNGEGLDENGRPIGGEDAPLAANLQSIQDHVFTPICTQCHVGAAAPLGFRLDQDSAYAMLVNAPSAEVPSLRRVTPGDPELSYLIQKLEGRAAVGAQMPLGQPALPQATINVIRQWIANGAPATASSAAAVVMPMQLHAIAPAFSEKLDAQHPQILVQADGEIAVSSLNSQSVVLIRSGGDGAFDNGNESQIAPLHFEVRSVHPTVLAIQPESGEWTADDYRLVIKGSGVTAVKDTDGLPVGELSLSFTVGETR
jgi:hypothetical protein